MTAHSIKDATSKAIAISSRSLGPKVSRENEDAFAPLIAIY
jgi:hypothetical protein